MSQMGSHPEDPGIKRDGTHESVRAGELHMTHATDSPGPKVLLVDPDPLSRRLVADTLRSKRHIIEAAEIEPDSPLIETEQPNLIVINGTVHQFEVGKLVHDIRADRRTASTPILLLTSRYQDTDGSHDGDIDHAIAAADRC